MTLYSAINAAREDLESLSLSLAADLRADTGISKRVDKALAALPDKPMTEDEIADIIITSGAKFFFREEVIKIIRALKAANCLYVEEK